MAYSDAKTNPFLISDDDHRPVPDMFARAATCHVEMLQALKTIARADCLRDDPCHSGILASSLSKQQLAAIIERVATMARKTLDRCDLE